MNGARLFLFANLGFFAVINSGPAMAQSDQELFGSAAPVVKEAPPVAADTSSGLLKTDTVKIGGSIFFESGLTENINAPNPFPTPLVTSYGDLFADARPKDDLRFFVKGRLTYPYTQTQAFELREALTDFQPAEDWFVRSGKQTANWGLGYYFSPGNLLDFTPIDPENPTAERTGPLAVKIQKPLGENNYYLYLLLDDAYSGGPIGIAPKAEWEANITP